MAQWWEHTPPTYVARDRSPGSTPDVFLAVAVIIAKAPYSLNAASEYKPCSKEQSLLKLGKKETDMIKCLEEQE